MKDSVTDLPLKVVCIENPSYVRGMQVGKTRYLKEAVSKNAKTPSCDTVCCTCICASRVCLVTRLLAYLVLNSLITKLKRRKNYKTL